MGVRFRRQHPIGPYIVDFYCAKAKLVIEVDGGQHNGSKSDILRDAFLRKRGCRVLRFWNNEILKNLNGVLHQITLSLDPSPSQAKEREN